MELESKNKNKKELGFRDWADLMVDSFGDVGKIAMLYAIASHYEDICIENRNSFPLLNLHGGMAVGKTMLSQTMSSIFTKRSKPIDLSLHDSQERGINVASGDSKRGVNIIEGYRSRPESDNALMGIYDKAGYYTISDGEAMKHHTVRTGTVICSQQPLSDIPTLFSRVIYCDMGSAPLYKKPFDFTKLQSISPHSVQWSFDELRPTIERTWNSEIIKARIEFLKEFEDDSEKRIWENWSTILAVFNMVAGKIHFRFQKQELMELIGESAKKQVRILKMGNSD